MLRRPVSVVKGPPLSDEPGLGALTLPGFLREVTERHAGREALVERRADGTVVRWSYRDLREHSIALAKALIASGLGKGDRVGIVMTNRAEFLSAVFGTALPGGVAAPLGTFSTQPELEHLVGSSACAVLLLERHVLRKDFAQSLCDLDPAIGVRETDALASRKFPFLRHLAMVDGAERMGAIAIWDDFLERGRDVSTAQVNARAAAVCPSDPGVLFFSSGSTNRPKES